MMMMNKTKTITTTTTRTRENPNNNVRYSGNHICTDIHACKYIYFEIDVSKASLIVSVSNSLFKICDYCLII